MAEEINKFTPEEIVDITSPGLNARLGRYFIGQTGNLSFTDHSFAWGGLINPEASGVNLYFDIFTVTNFSEQDFLAEIWLNAAPPANSALSAAVTASNQSVSPPPQPEAVMEHAYDFTESLTNGVNIFDRIVAPNSTLVSDSHQGSIIIGPGRTFSILLLPLKPGTFKGTIVLTWWEEKIFETEKISFDRR